MKTNPLSYSRLMLNVLITEQKMWAVYTMVCLIQKE